MRRVLECLYISFNEDDRSRRRNVTTIGWGIWTLIWPAGAGIWTIQSSKVQMSGEEEGGVEMLKFRVDRRIFIFD